ncbi:restriction endonuclease subunit S [Gluconobacter sphaericus]|uniref:restriction endonuclease subunit S n=1 Tax=Gluconobacter sphaericus TaxID=574987 RepID=UPI001B8D812D|nr:restriction endonuclease subunit S [Gluconobacter sphaericus]MBS1087271.1 restriction endonuclease subunit S [Gluconobacter sphaericus]MBS1101320.1 restriction endonuclease subunit S [Gluconobacter sphaericus]
MSFPKYPAYKDSGVEWIGEIPVGWKYCRLRFVAQFNPSKSEISYIPLNEEVSFLPMDAIGDDGAINLEQKRKISDVQNGYTYFRDMDVVFAKITPCFENGKGALVKGLLRGIGFGTTELIVARATQSRVIPEYLHSFFQSDIFRKPAEASMYGAGGQKRVSEPFVRDFSIPLPPLPEQQAIASFLDRECEKIDALIAEQERLIALLAEKRQAVISHAVTKGLNPNAPMKDSGIPWIGMVPEGWEVKCLRYVCDFEQGKAHEPFFDDDGEFICATARFVSTSGSSFKRCNTCLTKAEKRDILMVMSDLPNGRALARAFLVTENNIAINQRICKIVPRIGNECFYYYQLDRNQGLLKYDDKVNQTHLSNNAYKALPLIVPPLEEQNRIASYLQTFDEENVRLNQELLGSLILLKERRAALISAAVTGKIDVRAQSKALAA